MSDPRKSSTCDKKVWDECEDRLSDCLTDMLKATSNVESVASANCLTAACEQYLASHDWDFSSQVYRILAEAMWYASKGRLRGEALTEWIRSRAAVVDMPEEKEQMGICLFEPLVEEPVRIEDIDWLFGMLRDPRAAWAVEWAFENEDFPQNMIASYLEYAARETAAGRQPPSLPEKYDA